jgi:hypothetical protein
VDNEPQASSGARRFVSHRGALYGVLLAMVVASVVTVRVAVSRNDPATPVSSSGPLTSGTTTTATTISRRTEVITRLREILDVRDRALLARNAELLRDIYTVDCDCLEDGRSLIQQLRNENVVWRGVRTDITIRSTEEVNDRLWIVVAVVKTPSVRIETEAGQLIRTVPPERNLVRFALAKPGNAEEWLLGDASTFE